MLDREDNPYHMSYVDRDRGTKNNNILVILVFYGDIMDVVRLMFYSSILDYTYFIGLIYFVWFHFGEVLVT